MKTGFVVAEVLISEEEMVDLVSASVRKHYRYLVEDAAKPPQDYIDESLAEFDAGGQPAPYMDTDSMFRLLADGVRDDVIDAICDVEKRRAATQ